jgi:neutral ceramidase
MGGMGSGTPMPVRFPTHHKRSILSFFIGHGYVDGMKVTTLAVALAMSLVYAHGARAADPQWEAGAAAIKITPQKPIVMSGYASRIKPFERVEMDLYAKALILDDGVGHRGLIITMDLIGLSAKIAEPVAQRISEKTGLKRELILLNFAHNHAGPVLSLGPREEIDDPKPAPETIEYTKWMMDQLVDLVTKAMGNLQPAKLSWSTGVANFVMNRREFTPSGIILGVNSRGRADRTVPVLRIDDEQGKLKAVLFGCACHNTTLGPNNYAICGDFAGFAQAAIEEKMPGTIALFAIGCGGDANPWPRGSMEAAKYHGKSLGEEVSRVLNGKLTPISGPLTTVYDFVDLPLKRVTRQELVALAEKSPTWQMGNAKTMLAMLDRNQKLPTTYRAPVGLWQFGQSLTIVALSGEVVVDYVHEIENAIGPLNLWPMGYCNDYFGYLPSARVDQEGGYETRGLNSGQGWFSGEAQWMLIGKVKELAAQAGRQTIGK